MSRDTRRRWSIKEKKAFVKAYASPRRDNVKLALQFKVPLLALSLYNKRFKAKLTNGKAAKKASVKGAKKASVNSPSWGATQIMKLEATILDGKKAQKKLDKLINELLAS